MSKSRLLMGRGALLFILLIIIAGYGVALADTVDVNIADFAFSPTPVNITAGSAVRWTNNDAFPHTSTSDNATWNSGTISPGESFIHIFNTAGTFPYHCEFHFEMTATVIVAPVPSCCNLPGDANNNGAVNLLDVSFIINNLYRGGAAPPCPAEANANGTGGINLLDVSRIINALYRGGPAPICGP